MVEIPCDYGEVTTVETYSRAARTALSNVGCSILDAPKYVRPVPGLYSIHAKEGAWAELGLDYRAGIALYVGKSESNLFQRELRQHFAIAPGVSPSTGSSTVRRSFAALLREPLGLRGVPRNKEQPERFANFGLEPEGDSLLTRWMHENLTMAVWEMPEDMSASMLAVLEAEIIRLWTPPLNIQKNPDKVPHLRAARARLAADAKEWALAARNVQDPNGRYSP